mmetsp:Transcript_70323/g.117390  ORF Transcript_70323/g.117390 Transcript_70323/m.117390 type:complete len:88 (+) Transcript_70323:117-380(+)
MLLQHRPHLAELLDQLLATCVATSPPLKPHHNGLEMSQTPKLRNSKNCPFEISVTGGSAKSSYAICDHLSWEKHHLQHRGQQTDSHA